MMIFHHPLKLTMTTNLHLCALLSFFCCCCLCFHGIYSANNPTSNSPIYSESKAHDYFLKNIEKSSILEVGGEGSIGPRRLLLGGPGSSPPRCAWKCGGCMPCTPVHVPVPPGARVTTEYYPEAWRCKCGNKLYMP